jgi:hypothetical protein
MCGFFCSHCAAFFCAVPHSLAPHVLKEAGTMVAEALHSHANSASAALPVQVVAVQPMGSR